MVKKWQQNGNKIEKRQNSWKWQKRGKCFWGVHHHLKKPTVFLTFLPSLSFTAGACRETSIDQYTFHYDESQKVAVLKVSIEGCDLAAALYRNPRLQQTRFLYSATANVTLGIREDNFQMIFYNAIIGAECGFKRSYSVEHTYEVVFRKTSCFRWK